MSAKFLVSLSLAALFSLTSYASDKSVFSEKAIYQFQEDIFVPANKGYIDLDNLTFNGETDLRQESERTAPDLTIEGKTNCRLNFEYEEFPTHFSSKDQFVLLNTNSNSNSISPRYGTRNYFVFVNLEALKSDREINDSDKITLNCNQQVISKIKRTKKGTSSMINWFPEDIEYEFYDLHMKTLSKEKMSQIQEQLFVVTPVTDISQITRNR